MREDDETPDVAPLARKNDRTTPALSAATQVAAIFGLGDRAVHEIGGVLERQYSPLRRSLQEAARAAEAAAATAKGAERDLWLARHRDWVAALADYEAPREIRSPSRESIRALTRPAANRAARPAPPTEADRIEDEDESPPRPRFVAG